MTYREQVEKAFEENPCLCGLDVLEKFGKATDCLQILTTNEFFGGIGAIERVVLSWLEDEDKKNDVVFITELCIELNHKSWFWDEHGNSEFSKFYARLYSLTTKHAHKTFKDEDFRYFWQMTD